MTAIETGSLSKKSLEDLELMYGIEVDKIPRISHDELVKLMKQVEKGDKDAKNRIVEANLRLVFKVARAHQGRGVELIDLIQLGNLGLMKAVERFDYRRGLAFSTYAMYWIRQSIMRGVLDHGRTIRIPVHMMERINKYKSWCYSFTEENGSEPSKAEIAAELGLTEKEVEEYEMYWQSPVSMSTPLSEDGDESLLIQDIIVEEEAAGPTEFAEANMLKNEVATVLSMLPPKEKEVLEMRFGFNGHVPQTLDEIGQHYGVTRERIRQIQVKALKRMEEKAKKRGWEDLLRAD